MTRLLKSAIVLGIVPLLLGTVIYSTWRFTRWQWLETAGLINIAVGLTAFVVGVILLSVHLWRESRALRASRKSLWLQGLLVGGILAINFPVAAFYTLSAISVTTRYTLSFYNAANESLQNVVVTGPGVRVEIKSIAVDRRVKRHFHFYGDGTLDFVAHQGGKPLGGRIEDYVTHGTGGSKEVRIKAGGALEILPASQ